MEASTGTFLVLINSPVPNNCFSVLYLLANVLLFRYISCSMISFNVRSIDPNSGQCDKQYSEEDLKKNVTIGSKPCNF